MKDNSSIEVLSSLHIPGVYVSSWPVELTPTSNNKTAIDEFFTVNLHYQDSRNPCVEKRVTFMIPQETDAIFSAVFNVLETLDDVDGRCYDCAIDVVTESCELLIQEASTGSRRSLAMNVEVEVFEEKANPTVYDFDDDETEPMYGRKVCPICLDEFVKTHDDVAVLCCSHSIHQNCLKSRVLEGENTCPLCLSKIMMLEIVDINQVKRYANQS